MAEEQVASEPSNPTPAAKTQPPANPVRRLTLIVMAIGAVLFFYGIAADRITPYTAQALVQAYLVKIAPEVGGRVIEIGVGTDQRVEPGKVLFRIDPDQYMLAVRRAEAQLETSRTVDRRVDRRGRNGAGRSSSRPSPGARTHATRRRAPSSWSGRGSIPKHAGRRRRRRSIPPRPSSSRPKPN